MFNAYSLEEVVSKLPLEANSISNHGSLNYSFYNYFFIVFKGDTLLIGSKQGHLICCSQTFSCKFFQS